MSSHACCLKALELNGSRNQQNCKRAEKRDGVQKPIQTQSWNILIAFPFLLGREISLGMELMEKITESRGFVSRSQARALLAVLAIMSKPGLWLVGYRDVTGP